MVAADVRISRDQFVWAFSADMAPVVTVDPGSVIELETNDCFTGQVQTEADTIEALDFDRLNSATGPIFVRGAEPGDSLSVTLLDIVPGPQGSAMVIPGSGQLVEFCNAPVTRILKIENGTIWLNDRVSFPAKPMIGVIGVAPADGSVITFLADKHGGNLDDTVNGIGATRHFPDLKRGALPPLRTTRPTTSAAEVGGPGAERSEGVGEGLARPRDGIGLGAVHQVGPPNIGRVALDGEQLSRDGQFVASQPFG